MDWDTCNHKKLNQFTTEARRWKPGDNQPGESKPNESPVKRGAKVQPAKRKKKGKK